MAAAVLATSHPRCTSTNQVAAGTPEPRVRQQPGRPNAIEDAALKVIVAQDYPTKPVRLIEPFGVGGGPDLVARALARELCELWGQPVPVENVTGAGATAGPAQVANSPADGYTLLVNT